LRQSHTIDEGSGLDGKRTPLLVLGLGNVLCADDGAGVEAVRRLRSNYEIDARVRVLDGGTLGLTLLPYLASADRALLVDAIVSDDPPGTLVRAEGDEVPIIAQRELSCHQIGVADLLECARMIDVVPDVTLIGIIAASVEALGEPSRSVIRGIDRLVECVVGEIQELGFMIEQRSDDHDENPNRDRNDVSDAESRRWM
jgi:hydrogenase maturation protease